VAAAAATCGAAALTPDDDAPALRLFRAQLSPDTWDLPLNAEGIEEGGADSRARLRAAERAALPRAVRALARLASALAASHDARAARALPIVFDALVVVGGAADAESGRAARGAG
jgi:hypothetical protein